MIFLGAGASRPFGIKTLKEMGQDIIKMFEQNGHGELAKQLELGLAKYGMTLDFEAAYSIVEGLTNLEDSVKQSGPFTAYIGKDLKDYYKKDLNEMLRSLRKFVWKECTLKKFYENKIVNVYDRLFLSIKRITIQRRTICTKPRASNELLGRSG